MTFSQTEIGTLSEIFVKNYLMYLSIVCTSQRGEGALYCLCVRYVDFVLTPY
jgi:hypothetical protein